MSERLTPVDRSVEEAEGADFGVRLDGLPPERD